LIGALIHDLRRRGLSVAVLANDPQSPRSGGALLGDRIRTVMDPQDEGVYFRSFSTRGAPGGVSAAVGPAISWLTAFGFDVVLVETVGVGQDQVAVRHLVDRLVLLITPMTGDEVQWQKAGLIELADIVLVNKCDLAGAAGVQAELTTMLDLTRDHPVPKIMGVTAATGEGVPQLLDELIHEDERPD
jgi:LAO/AO transport system kinase